MTPQEIFDYKTQWMMNSKHYVKINEDADFDAKQWCKKNLEQHQWHFTRYTDVYEHTMYFETAEMKENFEKGYKNAI
jgi:hypothetical protein